MVRFSAIVPVYNGEKYLDRCLESVITSIGASREWEIVCVNDASTDATAGMLARWVAQSSVTFRVVRHAVNLGLGEARNTGLANARGEWIAWVDADDEVTADWASSIVRRVAELPVPDVVCFGAWMERNGRRLRMTPRRAPWTGAARTLLEDVVLDLGSSTWMWNKVFRKSVLEGLRFEGRCLEDFSLMPTILARARLARIVPEPLYVYHRPAGSLTRQGDCSGYRAGLERAAALTWREVDGLDDGFADVWREGVCLRIADFLRNIGDSEELRLRLRKQLWCVLSDGRQPLRIKAKCLFAALGVR